MAFSFNLKDLAAGAKGVVENPVNLSAAQSVLGYNPTPAYNSYRTAYDSANPGAIAPSFNSWVTQTVQAVGTSGIANYIKSQYELSTGKTMPQSVWNQVISTINGLPASSQNAIAQSIMLDLIPPGSGTNQSGPPSQPMSPATPTSAGTNLQALLKNVGPLQNLLYNSSGGQVGSTPALTPEQSRVLSLRNSVASQYQSIFGKAPSDGQVSAMVGMNASDQTNYLNNQQYKMGLTYGQWTVAQGNINAQYMKFFGRNATDAEVAWANGKSVDDISSHIMDSPSRVDGMNMGQYTSAKTALDAESTKQFGYAAPDEMIKAFHTSSLGQHGV